LSSDDDLDASGMILKTNHRNSSNHHADLDALNDLDGEENALHEFDFLTGDAAIATDHSHQYKSNGKTTCLSTIA
jgi:hypothetical protein